MYIKSIIIEGFKSYGRRTEIRDFDPEFTAITGLNGTGKSNILDSICFLLGITSPASVRANSMQELIFKNGQAGVTKATVTIIFDNSSVKQCPIGYEKCREISVARQIAVGGKNKFFINGKIVQTKKLLDFFACVQLNINNPNFLIMQGRITKVLNMRPPEILSMIEEAAGTSVYESKREASNKLIEKKEGRLRETNSLLEETVKPRLEKLKNEHAVYQEYNRIARDIDRLTRIHISSSYLKYKEVAKTIESNIAKIMERIAECQQTIEKNGGECERIDSEFQNLQNKIDASAEGLLKALEKELEGTKSKEYNVTKSIKLSKDKIQEAQKNLKKIESTIANIENTLQERKTEMSSIESLFKTLKENEENDKKAYEVAQTRFESVKMGLSTNDEGEAVSLQQQLIAANNEVKSAETKIKTLNIQLKQTLSELTNINSKEVADDYVSYKHNINLKEKLEKDIKNIEKHLRTINFDAENYASIQQRRSYVRVQIQSIKNELNNLRPEQYNLQYKDPEPHFDRQKVHGMAAKLFTIVNEETFLEAMSAAGGASLKSFITQDELTSKKILQKGQLTRRITIIPLNKIESYLLSDSRVAHAKILAGEDNIHKAIDLVTCNEKFYPARDFIFGGTLVCSNPEIAKKIAYHPDIKCRTATYQGDVMDPSGVVTGGKLKSHNLLREIAVIRNFEEQLSLNYKELQELEQNIAEIQSMERQYINVSRTLEERKVDLVNCINSLAQTAVQERKDKITALEQKIDTIKAEIEQANEWKKAAIAKEQNIKLKTSDITGYRKKEIKDAQDALNLAEKKAEKSSKELQNRQQNFDLLYLNIEELSKSIETHKLQKNEVISNLEKFNAELQDLNAESESVDKEMKTILASIKEHKDKINNQSRELKKLATLKDKLLKENADLGIEVKRKESEMLKNQNDEKDIYKKAEALEAKFAWILQEYPSFGKKNTVYDYTKEDPIQAGIKIEKLRKTKESMERSLNLNALALLEREEEIFNETIRRKQIVEEDKKKIQNIMFKMDEKKREQVDNAWKVVNENFGSIFSTLLHGAHARLRPVLQNNCLIGLQINVGFNGIWKESLEELSGGQRSLVALSLILAMLKFSPAPLYILDEVDAALDMSHTQNIGSMIKTHFSDSQFVIVSLKDGMFNNANVLFRTKFEDGLSVVTRHISVDKQNSKPK